MYNDHSEVVCFVDSILDWLEWLADSYPDSTDKMDVAGDIFESITTVDEFVIKESK